MSACRGIVNVGGDGGVSADGITVERLQSAIAEANRRMGCGWLCCVIDRSGWLPLDHWYPDEAHAPDVPHPVALVREARELVEALERYVRDFRPPNGKGPRAAGKRDTVLETASSPGQAVARGTDALPPRGGTVVGSSFRLPPRLPKTRLRDAVGPQRCPGHLAFVRGHACSVANPDCRGPIEAAHVRRGSGAGMGRKPDDDRAISLCAWHHQQQHTLGESAFQRLHSVDLDALARGFARRSPCWQRHVSKTRTRPT